MMRFPTMAEVEAADHELLCRWYRFLPAGVTAEEKPIMDRLVERFHALGGFTPAISKRLGWDAPGYGL
jgi:hypothetical protein